MQTKLKVKLIAHTPDADKVVAAAARLCYSAADVDTLMDGLTAEKVETMCQKLADLGHESPIEHASYTFAVEGVSRALLAQLTRHRIASYSVQSQRYVDKGEFDYITPSSIENNPDAEDIYNRCMMMIDLCYQELKQLGIPNEDARFVLPNACDTRIIFTMNARSLHNFFKLRCCNRAQWEIRELAWAMLKLCREQAPTLFKKAGPACLYGACPEGNMTCGKAKEVRERSQNL